MARSIVLALLAWTISLAACSDGGISPGGFNLQCNIDTDRFFDGGPGRDGIPSLSHPTILTAADATFMDDTMRVIGVEIDGEARAYPLFILWWHEIINDTLANRPILVSYCPLTGSGLGFHASVAGLSRRFGVSGLLFENNLVMFDRETESLWIQLLMGSQCGTSRGEMLDRIPVFETTWEHWRMLHPQTTVVSEETGFSRNYGAYPYEDYDDIGNPVLFFPSSPFSTARPTKEPILGIREAGGAAAYPSGILADLGDAVAINDEVAARPVLVTYVREYNAARAFDRRVDGQTLNFAVTGSTSFTLTDAETGSTWNQLGIATDGPLAGNQLQPLADAWTIFWFSWSVFYPETRLYQ